MHGCGRTVWFSSYLGCHAWISSFTLTLRCFSSDSDNCFHVWVGPLVQFPHPPRAPSNTPVFLSSSFLLSSFALVYIFSSTGQVLLPPLSWCSAYTSVSEGVFLMHPWREMCSTSTSSSSILFSCQLLVHYCCGCHWKTTSGELLVYARSHSAKSSWSHWICIATHEWFLKQNLKKYRWEGKLRKCKFLPSF